MIWFINSTAGACSSTCDGRLTNPYTTLAAFEAVNNGTGLNPNNGHSIFLYTGTGNYSGGITLRQNQRLIGQGTSLSLASASGIMFAPFSIVLPPTSGTRPTMTDTVGNVIALNSGNHIYGLNVTTATGGVGGINGSGVGNLTTSEVSVTTTTGTAVNINGGGTLAVSLTSVSANGAPSGISLQNTTGGTFQVTGTGIAGSGGTIQNSTGNGVFLSSVFGITFAHMTIQNSGDFGIRGSTVTGLSLTNVDVLNNGNSTSDEGIGLTNLFGTSTWTNVDVSASAHNNVWVRNTSGTMDSLTVTNSTFNNLVDSTGANSFLFESAGTATITSATITNSTFDNNSPQRALDVIAHDTSTITLITVSSNTFTNNGLHTSFAVDTSANLRFMMLNNLTMTGSLIQPINVFSSSTSTGGILRGRIAGNQIGTAGVGGSGSSTGGGIRILVQGRTQGIFEIDNNIIRETPNSRGIDAQFLGTTTTGQVVPTSDITITNNDTLYVKLKSNVSIPLKRLNINAKACVQDAFE